jgi:predicted nucleic acid-binding protein
VIVVSNASPLINLAAIGRLDLLHQLYGRIVIPRAVYREIVVDGTGQSGSDQVKTLEWIETRWVVDRVLVASLCLEVDEGEAESIVLASELEADLLLLDERRGRLVASRLGLRFVGLLGVLVEAKHRGLIPGVQPVLDDLIQKAGFWISRELYDRVLQAAGE